MAEHVPAQPVRVTGGPTSPPAGQSRNYRRNKRACQKRGTVEQRRPVVKLRTRSLLFNRLLFYFNIYYSVKIILRSLNSIYVGEFCLI